MYYCYTASPRDVDQMVLWCWAKVADIPSKHKTLNQCWLNGGPASATLANHWSNTWLISCCFFLGNHCPPSFFSSHLTFVRDIAGPSFAGSFWARPLRPTQFSLGEIGAKLYRFSDRPYSWQKNGKVSDEAGPQPGKLHLQAAVSLRSEWRPRWEIIIGRAQASNRVPLIQTVCRECHSFWPRASNGSLNIGLNKVPLGAQSVPSPWQMGSQFSPDWISLGILTTRCHWRRAVAYVSFWFEKRPNFLFTLEVLIASITVFSLPDWPSIFFYF